MTKKTCIITGGNAGIGKAAAIQIAEKGYNVIIACRSEERGRNIYAARHLSQSNFCNRKIF